MMSRKVYADRREERRDVLLGALGWILVNGLFVFVTVIIAGQWTARVEGNPEAVSTVGNVAAIAYMAALFANLAALVLFGRFRMFVALGMLAAIGGLLGIGIVVGVLATAVCLISQVGR